MVKQYPHTLVITTTAGSVQDGNGNWLPGTPLTITLPCRGEPNTRNVMLPSADGTVISFSFTVYMPMPDDDITIGSNVALYNGGTLLCKSTVKQFSRGQLNARLWL